MADAEFVQEFMKEKVRLIEQREACVLMVCVCGRILSLTTPDSSNLRGRMGRCAMS